MPIRKIYKLTNQSFQTYGGFQFTPDVWTPELDGSQGLCSPTCYHSYASPLLAVLLNPVHAIFKDPILWEGEADGFHTDDGLKQGDGRQRLLRQIPLPEITTTQRIAFGILCSLELSQTDDYKNWAAAWLSGDDRTAEAAKAAKEAAKEPEAAWAAAAWAEVWAAAKAKAKAKAKAEAEAWAAWAAVEAAKAAAKIDFQAISSKAMEY